MTFSLGIRNRDSRDFEQNIIFGAYISLIALFICSSICLMPEERLSKYIIPTRKECDVFTDFKKYYRENNEQKILPITDYYQSIITIRMIETICSNKFGKDVTRLIIFYYQYMMQNDGFKTGFYDGASIGPKVLLLGAGNVGKSTIWKHLQLLYGGGNKQIDKNDFKNSLESQLTRDMRSAIQYLYDSEEESDEKIDLSEPATAAAIRVLDSSAYRSGVLHADDPIVKDLKLLWNEPNIKAVFTDIRQRSSAFVSDSSLYFFDNLDKMCSDDYAPTDKEFLMNYFPTSGMVVAKIGTYDKPFRIIDTGGQRSERKKWIHSFGDVDCVIFVASLSHYNEELFEARSFNALSESITLFGEVMNTKVLKNSDMILFLNKVDIFEEKIKVIPITVSPMLQSYDGDTNSSDECIRYIQDLFLNMNSQRQIFVHVTCALNRRNIEMVWRDVQSVIIKQNLYPTVCFDVMGLV